MGNWFCIVSDPEQKVQEAISRLLRAKFQISPETLIMLKDAEDPQGIVDRFLAENEISPKEIPVLEPLHLKEKPIDEMSLKETQPTKSEKPILPSVSSKEAIAKDIATDIKVLKDPSPDLVSKGTLEDFVANFQDRYKRLRNIITQRLDGKGVIDIQEALRGNGTSGGKLGNTVKIVGMVTSKVPTKSGNVVIELEDLTGKISAIIQQKDTTLWAKAQILLLDQVICVEGAPVSSEMLIVKDLFLPDIPTNRDSRHAKEEICAVLLSDIHYGSYQFLEPVFQRFLKWLRGEEGTDEQRELAGTVKYLIINGDLVDGIGVYPNQLQDIFIYDLDGQYSGLAQILSEIPPHIHVIITPGNHDGVRTAIPRPAIDERFIGMLREKGLNITSLGCPCRVSLHGVQLLIYHGDSLVDMIGALSKPEVEAGFAAMREILRARHLAPIYGRGTNIVPEPRDWLVVDEVPDILHCGHIHVNSVGSYRKTLIINSGTFQSQTEYQKLIGIDPTPGIIPLVNLKTLNVKSLNFV